MLRIFFIPAALIFGRKPVYVLASMTMVLTNVGQALFQTRIQYIVLQALAGLAGSINDTIIQMTIADLFFVHQRATLNGIYSVMVVMETYLSLIPAGYIVKSQGWRWVWWWWAILNAIVLVLLLFAYQETHYRRPDGNCLVGGEVPMTAIPEEKPEYADTASDKRQGTTPSHPQPQETNAPEDPTPPARPVRKTYVQRITAFGGASEFSIHDYWRHMWRPFLFFFRIPAVAYVAIQYSFILCWVAVLATTQPILFAQPPYNFSSIGVGNINIAPFIGALIGSIYGGSLNDYYVVFMARRKSGVYDPKMRLHMLIVPTFLTPLGHWLYGISIARSQPWIVPLIGSGLVGFGIGSVVPVTLSYFADCYSEIVAEGLIVITYVRNGIATAAAFAVNPWLNGLGAQNMFISVGCLCLGIQLLTIPMVIWGRRARLLTAGYYHGIIDRG